MRLRRAKGAGAAGLAALTRWAGLTRKTGRRLLASGPGAICAEQSLLKTPPTGKDQRALSGGRAASASLSSTLTPFTSAPELEAGGIVG